MAFDIAAFRAAFPEFSDLVKYPDAMVTFWAEVGEKSLIECRWQDLYTYGLQLFVAHNLAIAAQNAAAGASGGTPGNVSGPRQSKKVGSASVTYDTGATNMKDAGLWNATSYGKQFLFTSRMIGAGALQV
jgi:hypothetical protein